MFQVHRLVVVDNEDHVIGVISLSDILSELVLKPSREFFSFFSSTMRSSHHYTVNFFSFICRPFKEEQFVFRRRKHWHYTRRNGI